jgi:SHS2 domain-containing protein
MTWTYKFLDHTADIAVEVSAENYNDLLLASAYAWKESVIDEFDIGIPVREIIEKKDSSIEELIINFLSELNYLLFTKKWIMHSIENIDVENLNDDWSLKSLIVGELLDEKKHKIKEEIKAVTFHQMDVKYINNRYTTRIVFDI